MSTPQQHDSDSQRVLVIIPTFNESENIEIIVRRVLASVPTVNVLVVDDGSPDGTGKIVDEMATTDDRINVMHRNEKNGLGAAYIAGFEWGLNAGYDVLVQMDADGSHAPEQLSRLLGALGHADVVLGSRWIPGGAVLNWPVSRKIISLSGSQYSRLALGIHVRDVTGGYRAFKREVLESIDYAGVASRGYCFQVDLAWRTIRSGFTVEEVPITFAERERGESKMSGSIVREAFVRVTQWGLAYRWHQLRALSARRKASVGRPTP